LVVSRVDPARPETRVGMPYPLPYTRYAIEITRQLAGCGPQLKALVTATVTSVTAAPDPKQIFVLDPNSLSSPFKTSSVLVGYQVNGAPASLNATAEDRSAQVIANVVSTAVKLASITALAGAGTAADEACSDEARAARDVIKKQAPIVAAATKLVEAYTARLKDLGLKAAALGSNLDTRTRDALSDAYDALARATQDLAEKKDVLDKALKIVTFVETKYWPDDGDTATGRFPLPASVFARWGNVDKNEKERDRFTVFASLAGATPLGRSLDQPDIVQPELGVPIRTPLTGRMRLCAGTPCAATDTPIAESVGDVMQLGYIYYLPCKSRPFSSIDCTFVMTDAGQLKSMGASQKAATAEGATGAAKDLVTQAAGLQDTLASAKTTRLQAATAEIKAKADYAAAVQALQPDPLKTATDDTATLKASTDLLSARRAQLEAEAALADALAKGVK